MRITVERRQVMSPVTRLQRGPVTLQCVCIWYIYVICTVQCTYLCYIQWYECMYWMRLRSMQFESCTWHVRTCCTKHMIYVCICSHSLSLSTSWNCIFLSFLHTILYGTTLCVDIIKNDFFFGEKSQNHNIMCVRQLSSLHCQDVLDTHPLFYLDSSQPSHRCWDLRLINCCCWLLHNTASLSSKQPGGCTLHSLSSSLWKPDFSVNIPALHWIPVRKGRFGVSKYRFLREPTFLGSEWAGLWYAPDKIQQNHAFPWHL